MIAKLRRDKILEEAKNKDIVYINDLVDLIGSSESSIRRDIRQLEKEGLIISFRGGGISLSKPNVEESYLKKLRLNQKEKDIIAKKAAKFIQNGDTIYVDSGTTAYCLFKYITAINLTIVTSNTKIFEFLPMNNNKCIILGGNIDEKLSSISGSYTEKMLSRMYFDKCFIGANGYEKEGNVYTFSQAEASKKVLVYENSRECYVLADKSKENKKAFIMMFPTEKINLITE